MARVAVRTLLKRVRDSLDTAEDEWLENATLLRWLNAALPRFQSMLHRESWVTDYGVYSIEASEATGSEGYELPVVASAIVGVYRVVDENDIRRLVPTTLEDRPFALVRAPATRFFATNQGVAGATTVHLRPLPVTDVYLVIYIKEPPHLVLENGAGIGPISMDISPNDGTITLTDGSSWADAGFAEGQRITLDGFLSVQNNVTVEIIEVDDDVIHVLSRDLSSETSATGSAILLDDETQQNYVDYPNGWEEWLVLEVARQGAGREEAVNSTIEQRKREVEADVQRMAADRLFTQGPKVRNVNGVENADWTVSSDLSSYSSWTFL